MEGFTLFNKGCGLAKQINVADQHVTLPVFQVNGKKPAATGDVVPTIIRNAVILYLGEL